MSVSSLLSPPVQSLFVRLLWDIDTSSNVVINVDRTFEEQRHHRHLLPPHPDIELMRFRLTVTLRKKYAELCKSRVGELTGLCLSICLSKPLFRSGRAKGIV